MKNKLVRAAVLAWIGLMALVGHAGAKTFVYVSNAEDGDIDGYEMAATGELKPLGKTPAGKSVMPMALSKDGAHLYAVLRSKPFKVMTFGIDTGTGSLKLEAAAPLADSMAYASVDHSGRYLLTASYGGNQIAVNPIGPNGLVEQGPQQSIPTGKKAHSIVVDQTNQYVYATNLGSAQVLQFKFDAATGKLTPNDPPLIKTPAGNGPRHLAVSNDNRFLYVMNELSANVGQFSIDTRSGTLTEVGYVGSLPPASGLQNGIDPEALSATATNGTTAKAAEDTTPRVWAADIAITPDGRFMYTSERTNSTLSLLSVAQDSGKLRYLASYPTEKQPRGIRVDPTGRFLVATGEKSDKISVYEIAKQTGVLTLVGRYPAGQGANWVVFANTK